MTHRFVLLALTLPALAGCSGGYLLTGPDATALAGRNAPMVVRLQRQEIWFHWPGVADAPMTFHRADGEMRSARTDKQGYAAVAMPAPDEPGPAEVKIHLQDNEGVTMAGTVRLYALPADRPVVAVDLDGLPVEPAAAAPAVDALKRIAADSQIIYLSRRRGTQPADAHAALEALGCPDGPVLPWRPVQPWYRLLPWQKAAPNPVAELHKRIPELWAGVSSAPASVQRFKDAGLQAVLVGDAVEGAQDQPVETWPNLILSRPAP